MRDGGRVSWQFSSRPIRRGVERVVDAAAVIIGDTNWHLGRADVVLLSCLDLNASRTLEAPQLPFAELIRLLETLDPARQLLGLGLSLSRHAVWLSGLQDEDYDNEPDDDGQGQPGVSVATIHSDVAPATPQYSPPPG